MLASTFSTRVSPTFNDLMRKWHSGLGWEF